MAEVLSATASRVINNLTRSGSRARQRVLTAIGETCFQPHGAARSLAWQHSLAIGLPILAPAGRSSMYRYLPYLADVLTQACHKQKILPKIRCKGLTVCGVVGDPAVVRGAYRAHLRQRYTGLTSDDTGTSSMGSDGCLWKRERAKR